MATTATVGYARSWGRRGGHRWSGFASFSCFSQAVRMPRHGSERTDNQSRSINYNSMKPTVRARSRQRILGLPRGCWARAILPQPSLPGKKPTPVAWLAGDIWPRI